MRVVWALVFLTTYSGQPASAQQESREGSPQGAIPAAPSTLPAPPTSPPPGPASSQRHSYAANARHVVKIVCKRGFEMSQGSGFIHKSGMVITAAHVVEGCKAGDVQMLVNGWSAISPKKQDRAVGVAAIVATEPVLDLALLKPSQRLEPGLAITPASTDVQIGDVVTFLGYPSGYQGVVPMMGVGYLSAIAPHPSPKPGVDATRAFVNGAFNKGNSGGPVIDVQTQTVVGLVHAKVAPLPSHVQSALDALRNQKSGFQYSATTVDRKTITVTEAQVVEMVLEHYKNQTQLVIGVMVLPADLRTFLQSQKITP